MPLKPCMGALASAIATTLLRGDPHLDDTVMHSRVTHSHGCPGSAKRPISIGTKVSGRRRRGCAGQGRGTPTCNQRGMRTRERASTARARKASPTRTFSIQFVCWKCMQASRPRSRLCRALSSTEISFFTPGLLAGGGTWSI